MYPSQWFLPRAKEFVTKPSTHTRGNLVNKNRTERLASTVQRVNNEDASLKPSDLGVVLMRNFGKDANKIHVGDEVVVMYTPVSKGYY